MTQQIANFFRLRSVAGQDTVKQDDFCAGLSDPGVHRVKGALCRTDQQAEDKSSQSGDQCGRCLDDIFRIIAQMVFGKKGTKDRAQQYPPRETRQRN